MEPTVLYLDIETYCDLDLKKVGVYRYVEHPSFRILMCAWAIGDSPILLEENEADVLLTLRDLILDPNVIKVAHNANFERVCFSAKLGLPVGKYLDPEAWEDTATIAAEHGYGRMLERVGKALGVQKDSAGTRLINLFSKPYRGRRVLPKERPEQWAEFGRYCVQDVEVMRHVRRTLGSWPTGRERQIYMTDQRINDYGMAVDVPLAQRARAAALANARVHEAEFTALTGVANPNSNVQVLAWAKAAGLGVANLQAETVAALLEKPLSPDHRRALELRQELALVAAKKFSAALERTCTDGRLRGTLVFHGAHTGRWAGKGVQPHNLPRAKFQDVVDETDAILELMVDGTGSPLTLKQLVRPMFLGPFTVADYASIEARVLAWMAGEEWALQAFRDGRDIYQETADRMGGLTRSQGKVAVLALGYNGAVGSLQAMGAHGNEEELLSLVFQWRRANPNIVRFWKRVDEAFRRGSGSVGPIRFGRNGSDRIIRLPSGRRLHYHEVKTDKRITFLDWSGRQVWRVDTYGGRLTENITQAVARDILGEALVRLEREGYQSVAHVHDEVLVEGWHPVEDVVTIMTQSPSWATGLPIDAEGFNCYRYRKG